MPRDQVDRVFQARSGETLDIEGVQFRSFHDGNPASGSQPFGIYLSSMGEADLTVQSEEIGALARRPLWLWSLLKGNAKNRLERDLSERSVHLEQYQRLLGVQRRFVETRNHGFNFFVLTQSFGIWHLWQTALQRPELLNWIDHFVLATPIFGLDANDPLNMRSFYAQHGASDLYDTWEDGAHALSQLTARFTFIVAAKDPVVDLSKTRAAYELIDPDRRRLVFLTGAAHRIFKAQDNPFLPAFLRTFPEYFSWGEIFPSEDQGIRVANRAEEFSSLT